MSTGVPDPEQVAAQVVGLLTRRGQTLAVAESLTGGLVVATLIAVPGASAVVRGGVVAYLSDLKADLLGVDPDLLAARGAVDPEVAAAMAIGVAVRLRADYGLATTGVAGPDPQDGHPVGVVHIAVAARDGAVSPLARTFDPGLGRQGIRAATVAAALESQTPARRYTASERKLRMEFYSTKGPR